MRFQNVSNTDNMLMQRVCNVFVESIRVLPYKRAVCIFLKVSARKSKWEMFVVRKLARAKFERLISAMNFSDVYVLNVHV